MVKAWKLNNEVVAVSVIGEPETVKLLEGSGLVDHCLTDHESQFHIPARHLHRYDRALGLDSAAQSALRQTPPGSELMITVDRGWMQSPAEQCDDGAGNDGVYGGCNPDCTRAGYCGDGIRQPAFEACDGGPQSGGSSGCTDTCTLQIG